MKKVLLLFLAVTAFTFVSCGDEETPKTQAELLVGKWKADKILIDGVEQNTLVQIPCEKETTIEFKADGTGLEELYAPKYDNAKSLSKSAAFDCVVDKTITFDYKVEANKLTQNETGVTSTDNGGPALKTSLRAMQASPGSRTITRTFEVTEDTLKLSHKTTGPEGGEVVITSVYKKM